MARGWRRAKDPPGSYRTTTRRRRPGRGVRRLAIPRARRPPRLAESTRCRRSPALLGVGIRAAVVWSRFRVAARANSLYPRSHDRRVGLENWGMNARENITVRTSTFSPEDQETLLEETILEWRALGCRRPGMRSTTCSIGGLRLAGSTPKSKRSIGLTSRCIPSLGSRNRNRLEARSSGSRSRPRRFRCSAPHP